MQSLCLNFLKLRRIRSSFRINTGRYHISNMIMYPIDILLDFFSIEVSSASSQFWKTLLLIESMFRGVRHVFLNVLFTQLYIDLKENFSICILYFVLRRSPQRLEPTYGFSAPWWYSYCYTGIPLLLSLNQIPPICGGCEHVWHQHS